MTPVAAGFITVSSLWMRPIGGSGGGMLGDRYAKETVLGVSLILASLGLICLIFFPKLSSAYFVMGLIMLMGVLIYAIRGLYWSLLTLCHIPIELTGLAIGLISVIGYLPDIFLPLIHALLTRGFPGLLSYQLYFGYIAFCGLLGAAATFCFKRSFGMRESQS
jgi:nitrate/nitrite transporter NarK